MLAFSVLSEAEIQGHTYISTSESIEMLAFSVLSAALSPVLSYDKMLPHLR